MLNRVQSNYKALQELVTIIIGVAAANIVASTISLFTAGQPTTLIVGPSTPQATAAAAEPLPPFERPSGGLYLLLGGGLVLLAVRFCHGNYRSLDEALVRGPEKAPEGPKGASRWAQPLELLILIFQGALLGSFGLLLSNPQDLWWALLILFCSDVVLWVLAFAVAGDIKAIPMHKTYWAVLNALAAIVLLSQCLFFLPFATTIGGSLFVGTVLDYTLNFDFYFPRDNQKELANADLSRNAD